MKRHFLLLTAALLRNAWVGIPARAQYVAVTLKLDVTSLPIGASALLHVFAQVVPVQRLSSERIFSWHVDLLNTSSSIAQADYTALQKPASDNMSQTSSGVTEGANRRGIYDTFITDVPRSKSGTGVTTPVELFSVPIKALAAGRATFRVTAGRNKGLAADFIVAPKSLDEPPRLGGVYDSATVGLDVTASGVCLPKLSAAATPLVGGKIKVTLDFVPCAGRTHVVEFRDRLNGGSWQPLPGGPHNSGGVSDADGVSARFYRIRINP
ncbi:MAG: hypothetical protein EXS36_14900 [Pedosphaera sp.]|nr:hypothetical protein [Pedosphaera sp.]